MGENSCVTLNTASRLVDKPKEIFHYTTISALQGILETNSLWATLADYSNDTSETRLIWPWFRKKIVENYQREVRDLIDSNPDPDSALTVTGEANLARLAELDGSTIVREIHNTILALGESSTPGTAPLFLVSFTSHSDDTRREQYHRKNGMLSQWRGYAGPEGVAVVFDTNALDGLLGHERDRFHYWPSFFAKVIYNWQEKPLESHFPELSEALQELVHHLIATPDDEGSQERSMSKMYNQFSVSQMLLKHAAFHEEKECRLVVGVMPASLVDSIDTGDEVQKSIKPIHHRPGNHGSVPYIRLFEECDENLPISRIIVGPSRNQQANLEKVRDLTRTRGITVQASDTPFVETT